MEQIKTKKKKKKKEHFFPRIQVETCAQMHTRAVVVISMGKPGGFPGPPYLILRATGAPQKSYVTYVPQTFVAHLSLL